jgi:hypothetical protein
MACEANRTRLFTSSSKFKDEIGLEPVFMHPGLVFGKSDGTGIPIVHRIRIEISGGKFQAIQEQIAEFYFMPFTVGAVKILIVHRTDEGIIFYP